MPNKSYAYLLNVEPTNLVHLKTYTTEFDEIIIAFTDQNGRSLEIEDEVNLTLFINRNDMLFKLSSATIFYRTKEPRTRKYVKRYGFLTFAKNYKKQLLDTGLDALKTVSKK